MIKRFGVLALIATMICGCATSAPTHYFILGSTATLPSEQKASAFTIALAPITLPKYLDRKPIVLRRGESELVVSDLNLWAEPLEHNIQSVIEALLSKNGGRTVPWDSEFNDRSNTILKLEVNLERFERMEGSHAILEASYLLSPSKDGTFSPRSFRTESPCSGNSYQETVSCMNIALNDLTSAILQEIKK